ncbi:MAG: hypothetical protein JWN57_2135 [Frankiales bacterium]|nr:hypothetical protein [Frankiales bacterium]
MTPPSAPEPRLSCDAWELVSGQLPVAVVVVDLHGRVVSWNDGAQALYGWPAAAAVGRPAREVITVLPDQLDLAAEVRSRTMAGEDWQGEFVTRHRDGRRLVVRVNNRPLRGPDGEVTGVVGVSLDLSPYREAIEAREAQLDQAQRRTQRLADRNSRLVEISEALGRALTGEEVVAAVLGQGVAALGAQAGGVVLIEDDHLRVLGAVGYEPHVAQAYDGLPLDASSPLTDVVRRGRPLRTGAAAELAALYPHLPHSVLSHSFAGVPLEVDGRVIGAMALSSTSEESFPAEEIAFLQTLARHCAQALERGRLFAAEQTTRERMAFLAMASERLSASLDVSETLDAVAALAVPALGDWCSVHLLDEQGAPQLVGVHHRDPERYTILRDLFERYPPEPDRGAGVGQAVGEQRLVHHRRFPEQALRAIARNDDHLAGLRKLRLGSALVVPLAVPTRTLGVLTLVRDEEDAYDESDISLMTDLARRMATAVDNALRFGQERQTAVTLQRSLLPRNLPHLPGLRLAHRYLPGTVGAAVGGDWYDVLPLPGGLVGLVIGDVMGRGVEAAAVMGQLRAALRAYAMVEPSPAAVLGLLDAAVGSLEQTAITTCLYGVFDPQTRLLRLASAGHLPPLIVHAEGGGSYVELEPGPPLGVAWDEPPETEVEVPEGAVLLLYTDGLVEGRHQPVEEGMLALRNAVAPPPEQDVEQLCDRVLRATGRDGRPDDDSALLAIGTDRRSTGRPGDVHLHLAGHHSEIARARLLAAGWARDAVVDQHDVALLVTELATNALRHGGPGVDMWLRTRPGALRCEVVDGRASAVPQLLEPDEEAEGGRGLVVVHALADRWGSETLSAGKCVWFELDREGDL